MGEDIKRIAAAAAGKTASASPPPQVDAPDMAAITKRIDAGKAQPGDTAALRTSVLQGRTHALAPAPLAARLVEGISGGKAAQLVIAVEVERLQESIGHSHSTGVERALIEHIGLCWLRLQIAESALTQYTAVQHSPAEARYREERLTQAQTRYLRAVGLLERLRRYRPAVQINIANQQVVKND